MVQMKCPLVVFCSSTLTIAGTRCFVTLIEPCDRMCRSMLCHGGARCEGVVQKRLLCTALPAKNKRPEQKMLSCSFRASQLVGSILQTGDWLQ